MRRTYQKLEKLCCQKNPQSLRFTFKKIKVKDMDLFTQLSIIQICINLQNKILRNQKKLTSKKSTKCKIYFFAQIIIVFQVKLHSTAQLSNNEMYGLTRKTSYQKLEKLCCQNNPQSLKFTFKQIKVRDGFIHLAFSQPNLHQCVE